MSSGPPAVLKYGERDREIWRLALPALGALIAEPLYLLTDTAVVGHLGTPQLGGLALASQVLFITTALFIFLAYGTTAAVSRLLGAGQIVEAARNAVQSMWLSVIVGVVLGISAWIFAEPLLRLLGGDGAVLDNALIYLRISTFGIPALLLMLSGVGYLRGLQDTKRPLIVAAVTAIANLVIEVVLIYGFGYDIGASALATVIAQWGGAFAYLWWIARAVRSHGVSLAPDGAIIRRLAVAGLDLFLRTASLRGSFTLAVAVAARMGDVELAAHEVTFALWSFCAFGLDAVAIAGQAMVGKLLGADDEAEARAVSHRIVQWGVLLGVVAMLVVLIGRPWIASIFTDDPAVISMVQFLFVFFALSQPINGVVFALDGILIGAGDLRFLAFAMAASAAVFIPMALAVLWTGLGIGWLWAALTVFMFARALTLVLRFRGDRWLVTGAM